MKKNDYKDEVIATAKKYLYDNPKFLFPNKRVKTEADRKLTGRREERRSSRQLHALKESNSLLYCQAPRSTR